MNSVNEVSQTIVNDSNKNMKLATLDECCVIATVVSGVSVASGIRTQKNKGGSV
jgi:hypothetical protein